VSIRTNGGFDGGFQALTKFFPAKTNITLYKEA
jgi:hypothetical protein